MVSHSAAWGSATTSAARWASERTAPRRSSTSASDRADRITPAPPEVTFWTRDRAAAATSADPPGRSAGSPCGSFPASNRSTTSRAAREANTMPSSSEFDASRLAPCTPVQATSPTAYRPSTDDRPSRSVTTPPEW
nr:hypothetical protein GCM10025730_36780 [Promicromonospora thailandica]